MQVYNVDTIKQVPAEGTIINFLFQFAVCGAHHSHLDLLIFLRSDPAELTVL